MNRLTKQKVILLVAAIFLVGTVLGGVVGFNYARQKTSRPPRSEQMASHMRDSLQSRLDLSEEQLQHIDPILQETAAEMRAIHMSSLERLRVTMKSSNERIKEFLTPEQIVKLEEMEKERRERYSRKYKSQQTTNQVR